MFALAQAALRFKSDVPAKVFACTLLVHLYTLDCSTQAVLARMPRELQDAAGAKKSVVAATKAFAFQG